MHVIAIAITLGFLAMAVIVFPSGVIRIKESFIDLFWSFAFYIDVLFEVGWNIYPTVTDLSVVPLTPFFGLPETWEEFVMLWNRYWEIIQTKENFEAYGIFVADLAEGRVYSIVVANGNPVYDSREGCNAIIKTTTNTLIKGCKTTVIPNSVTKIDSRAFRGCTSLENITITEIRLDSVGNIVTIFFI